MTAALDTDVMGRDDVAASGEAGYTLLEVVIVAIILGIMAGLTVMSFLSILNDRREAALANTAGTLWRATQNYRTDMEFRFPAALTMAELKTAETDTQYLRSWPDDPTDDGTPITVATAGAGGGPPATGTPNTIVYGVSGDRYDGWIAAYGRDGDPVFVRGVSRSAAPTIVPVR